MSKQGIKREMSSSPYSRCTNFRKNEGKGIAAADVSLGWIYGVAGIGLILNTPWGYKLAWLLGVIMIYHALSSWFWSGNQKKNGLSFTCHKKSRPHCHDKPPYMTIHITIYGILFKPRYQESLIIPHLLIGNKIA
jgi:hypothetical protein